MKTLLLVVCALIGFFCLPLSLHEPGASWLHYAHSGVLFEVDYPSELTATTSFLRNGPNNNDIYPVVTIGTLTRADFFVSISPKSRFFEDVLRNGYGSADKPLGTITVDGHEAVYLKQMIGDPPYKLEDEGFELFLRVGDLEYYIIVASQKGKKIVETLVFTSL